MASPSSPRGRKRAHSEQLDPKEPILQPKRPKKATATHERTENVEKVPKPSLDSHCGFADNAGDFGVPGLHYIPNFVTEDEERTLLSGIDALPWDNTLSRRVQQYGFRYDYTAKSIDANQSIDPLPSLMDDVVVRLTKDGHFKRTPDQCIVNGTFILSHLFHCLICCTDPLYRVPTWPRYLCTCGQDP